MSSLKADDNATKIPLHYPRGTGPLTDGTKNETCPLSRFVPSFRRLGTPLFLEGLRTYRLIQSLMRPYRRILAIIWDAMVLQTASSVAGPWPLKIILDNVVGSHKLPHWLDHLLAPLLSGTSKMQIAAAAANAAVLIAVVGAIASYGIRTHDRPVMGLTIKR
jgi:hypothetical protein